MPGGPEANTGLGTDFLRDASRRLGAFKQLDETQAKIEGRTGTARGHDFAVYDDAFGGESGGQLGVGRGVRGEPAAGEEAGVVQHKWSGADGGEPGVGHDVAAEQVAHLRGVAEGTHAGAAREKEQGVGRVGRDATKQSVGLECDTVAAGHQQIGAEGGERHPVAGAAQDINGGDSFYFFKTLW